MFQMCRHISLPLSLHIIFQIQEIVSFQYIHLSIDSLIIGNKTYFPAAAQQIGHYCFVSE